MLGRGLVRVRGRSDDGLVRWSGECQVNVRESQVNVQVNLNLSLTLLDVKLVFAFLCKDGVKVQQHFFRKSSIGIIGNISVHLTRKVEG